MQDMCKALVTHQLIEFPIIQIPNSKSKWDLFSNATGLFRENVYYVQSLALLQARRAP